MRRTTVYRVVTSVLVLFSSYSVLLICGFLLLKGTICATIALGVYVSVGLSILTILVTKLRLFLIYRQRQNLQTISPSLALPQLDSACAATVQCLMLSWLLLAGCGLLPVALRAPICLAQPLQQWSNTLAETSWKYGKTCTLHRSVVALSILIAISMCALSFFDEVDRQQRNRVSTFFFCCYRGTTPQEQACKQRMGTSVSSIEFDKEERLFMVPEGRPSRLEREQWLQRRNSLSSQRAIYPHRYHYYDPRSRYMVYSYAPSTRYSSTLRSVSEGHCLDLSDRNSSFTSSQSSGSLARSARLPPPTSSRYRSSSSPEKPGPGQVHNGLSGSGGGGGAGGGRGSTPVPDVPTLPVHPPPTWSPALQHAPLSSDPTIQALSTGSRLSHPRSSPALLELASESSYSSPSAVPVTSALDHTTGTSTKSKSKSQESRPETSTLALPPPPAQPVPTLPPSLPLPLLPPTVPPQPVTPNGNGSAPRAPSVALPPLPTRSPGHCIFPSTGTRTRTPRSASTSTSTTKPATPSPHSLRRPSPLRSVHRQYYEPQQYQRSVPVPSGANGNRYASGQGYGHGYGSQRVTNPNVSVSMYSASSYGTERSASVVGGVVGGGGGGKK